MSTYRYLEKQSMLYGMEKLVLRYLKTRFLRAADQEERLAAFRDLHRDFEQLLEDPIEQNAFRYFDFMAWLKSYLTGRPFSELVAEGSTVTA